MLFMLKPGVAERLEAYVEGGGTLLLTYLSGIVNETNIVFRGGWPGAGLRQMAGVWAEEIDSLVPNPPQRIVAAPGNALGLAGEHPVREYCERVHPEGASVLATYKIDFYAGMPALTVNRFGSGRVYYLAARPAEDAFHDGLVARPRPRAGARAPPGRRAARGRHRPEARGRRAGRSSSSTTCTGEEQALDLGATRLVDVDGRQRRSPGR